MFATKSFYRLVQIECAKLFSVIKLLAKSKLGISFRINEADETSYVSFMGKKLLNLINREKLVRRAKLHEFNLLAEHKGMYMLLGAMWVWGFCRGPCR
jgi:hypothetical protein